MQDLYTRAAAVLIFSATVAQAQAKPQKPPLRLGPFTVGEVFYPPIARAARVTGDVHVSVTLDRSGVTGISVLDGPVMLRLSAMRNVLDWSTPPDTEAQTITLTLTYALPENGKGESRNPTVKILSPDHLYIEAAMPILHIQNAHIKK